MRILVADDDSISRELFRTTLEDEHIVTEAGDGDEAWRLLQEQTFDLVISDWVMPGPSGAELCRRIRQREADERCEYTHVMLISARDEVKDVVTALQSGADEYVVKPVTPYELQARVATLGRLRQLQDILQQQNEELRRMQELTTEWVQMIVHDLRSPLAVIQGSCELIQMAPDKDHSRRLNVVAQEAGRIHRMLQDMLIAARSESGEITATQEPVVLNELLDESIDAISELATPRGVTLLKEYDSGLKVNADRFLLRRAVDNLLSNAIKYGGAGNVRLRALVRNGSATVAVIDEGPGVPADSVESIFESYAIAESSAPVSQIGLGLSFCRGVALAHGGTIRYSPMSPRGACFTLNWPVQAADESGAGESGAGESASDEAVPRSSERPGSKGAAPHA